MNECHAHGKIQYITKSNQSMLSLYTLLLNLLFYLLKGGKLCPSCKKPVRRRQMRRLHYPSGPSLDTAS